MLEVKNLSYEVTIGHLLSSYMSFLKLLTGSCVYMLQVFIVYMCLCSQVDTAAQIPWYERLSEFKMPWEIKGNKQTAINKLSLTVHSGQMLALIGSSGDAQRFEVLLY